MEAAVLDIPEKYRDVCLKKLQPSAKSRLPLDEQAKLYNDLMEHTNEGWAFFAPAGYSKTTCSWGLYKYALAYNFTRIEQLGGGRYEWVVNEGRRQAYYPPCYVYNESVPEWITRIQASWDGEPKPRLTFEKIKKARQDGFKPRVFLSEIDKIKEASEWNLNQIFMLFDAIDKHKGQLVFDSNLSKQQFVDRFGDAIARRVKENCNIREYGF
jgi:hypothetical protein